jgi:hypothetical protein
MFHSIVKTVLQNTRMLGIALFTVVFVLLSASAFAGTCVGGLDNGRSCTFSSQCRGWCLSGPHYHQYCTGSSQCGSTCANNGLPCFGNGDCPGSFCQFHQCQFAYCSTSFAALEMELELTCADDAFSLDTEKLALP